MREARGPPNRSSLTALSISCWLLELASQSPSTWQLQGVDISRLNYPADEYLPKNISLNTMDVFGEIPDDMVDNFDVVHIRASGLSLHIRIPCRYSVTSLAC